MPLVTEIPFVPIGPRSASWSESAPNPSRPRDALTVAEVAERLGVDQKTARRAIAEGVILGVWVGNRLLIPRPWFDLWLRGEALSPLDRVPSLPAQESTTTRRGRRTPTR